MIVLFVKRFFFLLRKHIVFTMSGFIWNSKPARYRLNFHSSFTVDIFDGDRDDRFVTVERKGKSPVREETTTREEAASFGDDSISGAGSP